MVSRVKAVLRRKKEIQQTEPVIQAGNISLDREKYFVIKSGKEIHLPRRQFNLLSLFISNGGKVVRRDIHMRRIWEDDVFVSERNIDVQIRKICEKIRTERIKTVKGVGYKFVS